MCSLFWLWSEGTFPEARHHRGLLHFFSYLASPCRVPQRIVQLSQATAKLSSEGASTRARAADAEDTMEKIAHDLEVCVVLSNEYIASRLLLSAKKKKEFSYIRTGIMPVPWTLVLYVVFVSCTASLSCFHMFACSV